MRIQKTTLFLLLLTLFAACKSSKKVVTINEEIMANPGTGRVWYTHGNILTKGTQSLTLFSRADLMRRAEPDAGPTYSLNFSPTSLLEMKQYPAGDTVLAASTGRSQSVNAPYYFVNTNNRRILGLWQADAYRMYMVYRFIAYKDNGGYVVELAQLQ
ncbi:MAG: hypothetical protein EOP52_10700 [Sphingobacteriales bacterium]|nr:MAG: hypothetical protein EOP52_10700 [Sphingobacteriales bacterium]